MRIVECGCVYANISPESIVRRCWVHEDECLRALQRTQPPTTVVIEQRRMIADLRAEIDRMRSAPTAAVKLRYRKGVRALSKETYLTRQHAKDALDRMRDKHLFEIVELILRP